MNLLRNTYFASLFLLGFGGYAQDNRSDSLAIKNMNSLTQSIIEYHEEKFNVDYRGRVPEVLFDLPLDSSASALYSVEDEAIHLSPSKKKIDISPLLDSISTGDISLNLFLLRKSISHELGHFLTDVYISTYNSSSWLAPTFEKKSQRTLDDLDIELIVEGIAEHFENAFTDSNNSFLDERWGYSYTSDQFQNNNFLNVLRNSGARNIVEPILSKNTHNGILWLLENELYLQPPNLLPVMEYKNSFLK